MRPILQALRFVPLACAALYACSDDDPAEKPPSPYDDVVYEGGVTDEALISLVSALEQRMPIEEPSKAPTLDAPAAGEVAKSPIPTFTWHIGATSRLGSPADPARAALFQAPGLPRRPAADTDVSWLGPLAELVGPIRSAEAHGVPYTGTATWVVFSTSASPQLHRVFTSELTHTPSEAAWSAMIAAESPITVTLVGGIFESNRLAADGGPFAGSSLQFTIAP